MNAPTKGHMRTERGRHGSIEVVRPNYEGKGSTRREIHATHVATFWHTHVEGEAEANAALFLDETHDPASNAELRRRMTEAEERADRLSGELNRERDRTTKLLIDLEEARGEGPS